MTSYIPFETYSENEKVKIIDSSNRESIGRILRVTRHKDVYGIISVLTDDEKKDLLTIKYTNKISKL